MQPKAASPAPSDLATEAPQGEAARAECGVEPTERLGMEGPGEGKEEGPSGHCQERERADGLQQSQVAEEAEEQARAKARQAQEELENRTREARRRSQALPPPLFGRRLPLHSLLALPLNVAPLTS